MSNPHVFVRKWGSCAVSSQPLLVLASPRQLLTGWRNQEGKEGGSKQSAFYQKTCAAPGPKRWAIVACLPTVHGKSQRDGMLARRLLVLKAVHPVVSAQTFLSPRTLRPCGKLRTSGGFCVANVCARPCVCGKHFLHKRLQRVRALVEMIPESERKKRRLQL